MSVEKRCESGLPDDLGTHVSRQLTRAELLAKIRTSLDARIISDDVQGRTGNLIGIAYLMGHKHVTTTKEYLHSNLEEAEAVLFRTSYFTSPAEAAPTTAELIVQAAEMIGCGREDSRVTGIWQSGADASPGSGQIPGAIRRPLQGAEYTVGPVLVDPPDVFARCWVRKRGLEPPRVLPH